MPLEFSIDKCFENPCVGCPVAQLTDPDMAHANDAVSSVLVHSSYGNMQTATVVEIVGMASEVTDNHRVRNLVGPVAGALALKVANKCEN